MVFTIRGTNIMILDAIPAPFFVISYDHWKLIDGNANLWRASNAKPHLLLGPARRYGDVSLKIWNFRLCRMQNRAAVVLVFALVLMAITNWLINEARQVKFGHEPHHTLHVGYEDRSSTVAKVLCYKSEGCWFDSRWCHWNFSST